jgi:acetyltransferase-like isoleucine patch superfamily enzyme
MGRWVHLGAGTVLRCHEGTLHVGDKCVFGQDNTVNCHLDVRIGDGCIVADSVYIGDFDHRTDSTAIPIRRQGLVKSPVTIGPDVWLGVKSTVLRGSIIGEGSAIGANAVVRGSIPEFSVAGGVPARVLADRREREEEAAQVRRDVADMARKAREATQALIAGEEVP